MEIRPGRLGVALRRRWLGVCCGALLLLPFTTRAAAPDFQPLPRVLIVGGGPSPEYNQAAIESNVRYLGRLLPPGTTRTTLFADGDLQRETVLYETTAKKSSPGEHLLNLLLEGRDGADDETLRYRRPKLSTLDGASKLADVSRVFGQLSREEREESPPRPLLLYFTGHGSPDRGNGDNNHFDLWGRQEHLSVRDLSTQIARLPSAVPVTLVMVQCFSGAFGNLIFEGGDPDGPLADRDIAGFFATVNDRTAAGCTPAINEAEYRDFTSYFFAALSGRDRVGRRVSGADYNGDGRVGMDEAYCYALANDDSIDVPICTSDVFLRRFVVRKKEDIFSVPYRRLKAWATPGQRAALESLSSYLHLQGEDRASTAYDKEFSGAGGRYARTGDYRAAMQRFDTLRDEGKRALLERWPDLKDADAAAASRTRPQAIAWLTRQIRDGRWDSLLNAEKAADAASDAQYAAELQEARLFRFVRLCKTVALAHFLHDSADKTLLARYDRLTAAEGRTPLPPADSFARADTSANLLP